MQLEFLIHDQPAGLTKSFRIGDLVVSGPVFIPEVKGEEDVEVVLKFHQGIPDGNPILAPAHRLPQLISNPRFTQGDPLNGIPPVSQFIKRHPVILYDPPELFRYTFSKKLVSYALKGDKGAGARFTKFLKKGEPDSALALVPEFFRPFIERQLPSIYSDIGLKDYTDEKTSHVERAWLDSVVNEAYGPYMLEIANQAIKLPHSAIIPPVPPLMKSSDSAYLSRIVSSNLGASIACEFISKDSGSKQVLPYYHMYIDAEVFDSSQGNGITTALNVLERGLTRGGSYCGVAITLNGYEKAFSTQLAPKLEMLITDVVNIAHEHYLPVILPRSNSYGLYFTDQDIQGFGSLLNGGHTSIRGGAIKNEDDKFGKTYLIEHCIELKLRDVVKYLNQHKEFPSVPGLPTRPSLEDLGNPKNYRINWAKPQRLCGIEEARRIRVAKLKGNLSPANLYLQRSSNSFLNHL